jgi:ferric-dicitrate binding protein FerR (iron transport regulator)
MESFMLAQAESRLRRLEADVQQLRQLEALRHVADEQSRFLRRNTIIVIAGMALLGAFFVWLGRMA